MTLTLDIASELEHQILQEARRKGLDTKSFVLHLLREAMASKVSSVAAQRESELLLEINRGFPPEVWKRYRELVAKREDETLSVEEHAELIALIDQVELANARRIECLAELANLRQVPLRELMTKMGIQPTADA
jgi:hypothetical protein